MDIINHDFYLVGIGASAGGLTAIQKLFDNIPDNTGMAFVIVQHLSPDYKSLMPELLAKHTRMEIYTSEDDQEIIPNCIYLNQRNKNIRVEGNRLFLLERASKHELNLPIDIFFHSVGNEYKEKSIGIILSGTGSDGSRGIKTIKETGGTIIVEDPFSAQFDGMPNSAISTNLVDYVLPPDKMGETLVEITTKSLKLSKEEQQVSNFNEIAFFNILDEIHISSGIDFRQYKRNTLLRRIEKRMHINDIETIKEYQVFLSDNQEEKEILKKDFFIGVTSFFRDPEAFDSLKTKVIPELYKNKDNAELVRVWVPGCSTGEEVFSIAILMDQYIREHKPNCDFKIFATDVDVNALNKASEAVFHINAAAELDKEFLEKYFVKTSDKIQIIQRIRKKVLFSSHNVLRDPPFIRMDLISCRNMLIYINSVAQQNIFKNFLFSLNKYGYLFLGSSETLGDVGKHFKIIDGKWKIYQNISDTKILPSHTYDLETKSMAIPFKFPSVSLSKMEYHFDEAPESVYERYLSRRVSPDCIFFD
ncbi:MAG: chemotaxis protein CheB [Mangrovibacterium sp.]